MTRVDCLITFGPLLFGVTAFLLIAAGRQGLKEWRAWRAYR